VDCRRVDAEWTEEACLEVAGLFHLLLLMTIIIRCPVICFYICLTEYDHAMVMYPLIYIYSLFVIRLKICSASVAVFACSFMTPQLWSDIHLCIFTHSTYMIRTLSIRSSYAIQMKATPYLFRKRHTVGVRDVYEKFGCAATMSLYSPCCTPKA